MSTTAGLGSGEYVAINATAVTAFLFGLLSAVAVLGNLLLLVPVIGVVLAIMAIGQIRGSNGTQTGKWLAILGLILSLGIGGYVIGGEIMEISRSRANQAGIEAKIAELESAVKAGDWDGAYALFTERFHATVPLELFRTRWDSLQNSEFYGSIAGIRWNGARMVVGRNDQDQALSAAAMGVFTFEKVDTQSRAEMYFRNDGGQWKIDSLPLLFPPAGADGTAPGMQ